MKILVSNDDGINAPGIQALVDALKKNADVFVVAPDREQSAVGHAITIHDPLKVSKTYVDNKLFGYAVSGTPADCVKLALCSLMKDNPPDLIVSGVNHGANLGTDIIYSGTVSAATEGTLLGIPSIAISVNSFERDAKFSVAAGVVIEVIEKINEFNLPKGTLLNVNVPNIERDEIKGWKLTYQGKTKYIEKYVKRTDPRGNSYYWIDGDLVESEDETDADFRAVKEDYISITPIHFDVTNHNYLAEIRERMEKMLNG